MATPHDHRAAELASPRRPHCSLKGDSVWRPLTLGSTAGEWFAHPAVGPALTVAMTSGLSSEQSDEVLEGNEGALRLADCRPWRCVSSSGSSPSRFRTRRWSGS